MTQATGHAYVLKLCFLTCKMELARARPHVVSRERADKMPVTIRRGAHTGKGTMSASCWCKGGRSRYPLPGDPVSRPTYGAI